jgi:hypothetical protein
MYCGKMRRNVGQFLPDYTAQQPTKRPHSDSSPREPQVSSFVFLSSQTKVGCFKFMIPLCAHSVAYGSVPLVPTHRLLHFFPLSLRLCAETWCNFVVKIKRFSPRVCLTDRQKSVTRTARSNLKIPSSSCLCKPLHTAVSVSLSWLHVSRHMHALTQLLRNISSRSHIVRRLPRAI